MKNFQDTLRQLKEKGRLRSLSLPAGIDLTSNDYLGLAGSDVLRSAAIEFLQNDGEIGSGGSRLLRGHTATHAALEDFAADYFAVPKCLYFSSGFQANAAIFQALPGRHDTIIFDEFVHASAREGIQNSHARHIKAKHNDLDSFEDALKKAEGQKWIAVESVYSMDGDIAPLGELYTLAEQYDAFLIIDEAHGTGVMGPNGKGFSEELVFKHGYGRIMTLHTCGKAIGVAGGLICAAEEIIDTLINTARGFIYSTAPLPLQAYLVQKSLEWIASEEGQKARAQLKALSLKVQEFFGGPGTHIVPIILGSDDEAVEVAAVLQEKGYDIRAIRPPTVPEGTARLRLSLSAALEEKTLENFAMALDEITRKKVA